MEPMDQCQLPFYNQHSSIKQSCQEPTPRYVFSSGPRRKCSASQNPSQFMTSKYSQSSYRLDWKSKQHPVSTLEQRCSSRKVSRRSPWNEFTVHSRASPRLILRPGAYCKPACNAKSQTNEQIKATRWVPAALDTLRGIVQAQGDTKLEVRDPGLRAQYFTVLNVLIPRCSSRVISRLPLGLARRWSQLLGNP